MGRRYGMVSRPYDGAGMDTVDRKTRSWMMSRVRSKGNRTTEWRVRAALVQSGISGWRLRPRGIKGTPDFFFPAARVVVFVDGCFWHICPRCYRRPKSRQEYWDGKRASNLARDHAVTTELWLAGFTVLRFWEHEVAQDLPGVVARIRTALEWARVSLEGGARHGFAGEARSKRHANGMIVS